MHQPSNTRKSQRNRLAARRKSGRSPGGGDAILAPGKDLGFQKIIQMEIPGSFDLVQPTSGLFAGDFPMNSTLIDSFSSRYSGFLEYRIRAVTWAIVPLLGSDPAGAPFGGTLNGSTYFFIDQVSTATPTLTDAEEFVSQLFANTASSAPRCNHKGSSWSGYNIVWRSKDVLEAVWTPVTAVSPFIATLKVYTDSTSLQTPNSLSTPLFMLRPWVVVQFRGFK